jgi:hypothetical protein
VTTPRRRFFADLKTRDPEKLRRLASDGGKASPHTTQWTKKEARKWGKEANRVRWGKK